ncbi:MAG: efflux RND transporter periplasmic adaptor subunit [Pseudomonadota bacterium]
MADQVRHRLQGLTGATRPLIVLLAALLLAACGEQAAQQGPGRGQRPPIAVVAEVVLPRPMRDTIEAIGTTLADESVTLSSKVTDTVSAVRFEDGDYTEAGAVLVELTNTEETALLAEAQATVDDTRQQLERLDDLYARRTIPVSQLDEAKARANEARARYESVVARLNDRLIRAPFAGVLGFRQVSPGTLLTPGTAICTLDAVDHIKLDFAVPEIHLAQLRPGMALRAASAAYPEQRFEAEVRTVGSRVDPVTRTAQVRTVIDNAARFLRPGMLMTVKLSARERQSLAVPEIALVQRSGSVFVYVVDAQDEGPTIASLRQVRIGGRFDGWAEVLEGLDERERVVTEGVLKIRDGAPVRVLEATAQGPVAAFGCTLPRSAAELT